MRYQERIYIQNENSAVRNKHIFNVNMSSDMCVFNNPLFNVSGTTKIDCTGSTSGSSYIVSATTIPLTFDFTANTNTFTETNAKFKYEIYKYNTTANAFIMPAVYSSASISYSAISGTSSYTENVPVSGLSLDGEYLIKGYYDFNVCTNFLNKLDKTVDTRTYISGTEYGLYDKQLDYYFMAMSPADTPILTKTASNTPIPNKLFQQVILPEIDINKVFITNRVAGDFIVTLNGLVLAIDYDYTYSENVITLSANTVKDDIITIIYTTTGGDNLVGDVINVSSTIISGSTDNQGNNLIYFNTTSSKYEIYTSVTPLDGSNILVMINGASLANGVDYYQSSTNPKRIILEGDIIVDDIITIVYFPRVNVINGLLTNSPRISWTIPNAPQKTNGFFTLEVSTASTFNSLFASATTDYQVGVVSYNASFVASGEVGTNLYYRIKNEKNYETFCGQFVSSTGYSETIPLTIQTNSINSY
jgi:hypothetical protein